MIIVPTSRVASFLLGRDASRQRLGDFVDLLMNHIEKDVENQSAEVILLQSCDLYYKKSQNHAADDILMGPIAVAAAFLHDSDLFHRVVSQTTAGFDKKSFFGLGSRVCLQKPAVSKAE